MSTNKIMELADTYACNRHADGYAHMEETPNTAKARAALQAEVECVTKELAASEAINKAAAREIVSLRAELAAPKAEPVAAFQCHMCNHEQYGGDMECGNCGRMFHVEQAQGAKK